VLVLECVQVQGCPDCGTVTDRVHSRRMMAVRDLPFGRPWLVRWDKRRLFCDVRRCPRRTFVERSTQLGPRQRLTGRLRAALERAVSASRRAAGTAAWFRLRYTAAASATWNRELATLRSAVMWWRTQGWLEADPTVLIERRRQTPDRTRALTVAQLQGLWRREDVALRDKTLWRLLYETAARATEVLGLDASDLDLANKRARVRSKGGATEWVFWQTGCAQLLPRLLAGRTAGPVFLADRRPTRAVATLDQDSATGRARLSYRRAAHQFSAATGWTLHQLRQASSGDL